MSSSFTEVKMCVLNNVVDLTLPVDGAAGPIRFWPIGSKTKSRQEGPEKSVNPHQHNGQRNMSLLDPLTCGEASKQTLVGFL